MARRGCCGGIRRRAGRARGGARETHGARGRVLRREMALQRLRPGARAEPRGHRARSSRTERALRERAAGARARPTARTHRHAARHRARPGGGSGRDRCAGADAARRRRRGRPPPRRRRAGRQCGQRRSSQRSTRVAGAGNRLGRGRCDSDRYAGCDRRCRGRGSGGRRSCPRLRLPGFPGRTARRPGGKPARRVVGLCQATAQLASRRGRCARRARGQRLGRPGKRRAVPASRAREGAQRRDPRQHCRRHRRRRPRGTGRALERRRLEDHRRGG